MSVSSTITAIACPNEVQQNTLYLLRRELQVRIYSAISIACRLTEPPDKYRTPLTTDIVTGSLHVQVSALELKPTALER